MKKPAKVVKVIPKLPTKGPKVSFNKKEDKDSFICVNCGYSGRGVFDEETHQQLCPECGANLEEGDLLRYKTPQSYTADDDVSDLGGVNLGGDLE